MRTALVTLLFIAALAAGAAQPAAADTTASFTSGPGYARCETVWQYGVLGAYGAWGRYIDGCTAAATCPYAAGCVIEHAYGHLKHYTEQSNQRVTCNSRLRIYTASGVWRYSQDRSGSGYTYCNASHTGTTATLGYGERAEVQSNGVRNDVNAYAKIISDVGLLDYAERCMYYTRVYGC